MSTYCFWMTKMSKITHWFIYRVWASQKWGTHVHTIIAHEFVVYLYSLQAQCQIDVEMCAFETGLGVKVAPSVVTGSGMDFLIGRVSYTYSLQVSLSFWRGFATDGLQFSILYPCNQALLMKCRDSYYDNYVLVFGICLQCLTLKYVAEVWFQILQ